MAMKCLFCGTITYDIYKHTNSANMESFLCVLLGAKGHTCFNNAETTYDTFLYNAIEFVSQIIRIYMKYGRPSIAFRPPHVAVKCIGVQGPQFGIPQ